MITALLLILYYSVGVQMISTAERYASKPVKAGLFSYFLLAAFWPLILIMASLDQIASRLRN